jgi:hypothetical protein
MKLRTASETIRFIRSLEEKAGAFYEELAKKFPGQTQLFLSYAKENQKYVKQVQTAYQSVITDAIEACFAFDLETDDFFIDTDLSEGASLSEAACKARAVEERILMCYGAGAEQSGPLLADVPRNFKMIVKKRQGRLEKLASLQQ